MSKGKDIASLYTREKNKKCGRHGFGMWKSEKIVNISPKEYGNFINKRKSK